MDYNYSRTYAPQAQNYASLSMYNQGSQVRVPAPATSGLYVVPVFDTYGYNSLTSQRNAVYSVPSTNGYFTLDSAYGNCGNELTGVPYVRSACM